ncbi:sigma-54-dependent transcriptional regulator [Longimicrobium terrae]|uniref:DNA-binding NtrC family response regulator n=1 Tax=Longimicrobium terrae TaxID=1639882 RepID=A0A841H321_9BACT|nr:sigma-54 dependent transcriptional regulator [Longimicrobium terrae]MBB4638119.1 DNA-binding NtrC family response regulator [Longimicrobium terrae]MBB6072491.1 DNA-binding NtrC family response regulator [Longimicrobium terrae]NNC32098.1 sigma-54-dependent Fis family transcriptional regulator [Longimicrobium terrae]
MTDERGATVLVVDDDAPMRHTVVEVLLAHGYRAVPCAGAREAMEQMQTEGADLVVTDLRMPGMKGDALLREIREAFPEVPVIAVTAFGSVEDAMALTRAGAFDYLEKPFRTQPLLDSIERGLRESAPRREQARLQRSGGDHLDELVGSTPPMQSLFSRIARVALSPAPVLITGESGTGKELVARAVHKASHRRPLLTVNCGAIPDQLLESELFGHARGAFTGAATDKRGLFQAADGGTLFLDEIGEMPLSLQPKLLRVIESGEVRRVGDVNARQYNVRIIAATNRDLAAEVEEGRFREDLYWRLRVLHLELPPLRERAGDIPLIVDRFLRDSAARSGMRKTLTPAAVHLLAEFHWPGNVRQLRNTLESALVFAPGDEVGAEDFPDEIRRALGNREVVRSAAERGLSLAELERDYIFETLRRLGGNKSRAAEQLGIPRRTLYRRLDEYAAEGGKGPSGASSGG